MNILFDLLLMVSLETLISHKSCYTYIQTNESDTIVYLLDCSFLLEYFSTLQIYFTTWPNSFRHATADSTP